MEADGSRHPYSVALSGIFVCSKKPRNIHTPLFGCTLFPTLATQYFIFFMTHWPYSTRNRPAISFGEHTLAFKQPMLYIRQESRAIPACYGIALDSKKLLLRLDCKSVTKIYLQTFIFTYHSCTKVIRT